MLRFATLLLTISATVFAQSLSSRTTLSGTLVDPSDAQVPGIRVNLVAGGRTAETVTGPTGEFRFENLVPGDYELRCEAPGFERVVQRVRIGNRAQQRVRVRLTIASLKEELSVVEGERTIAPQADRNADTISVERTMLDNLPFLDNNVSFRQACVSQFRSGFLLFQQPPNRCSADLQPPRDLRFADACEK